MNEPSATATASPLTPTRPTTAKPSTSPTSTTTTTMAAKDAPALATTKRKFHRLLDSITGNSPRTKASSTIPHETAAKRIRLEARSRLEGRDTPGLQQTSQLSPYVQSQLLASRLAAASTSRKSTDTVAVKEPNYLPWSHEQFLARLKTFADVRVWTPKPESVGEVEWAKRGWSCRAWNTVVCKGGCDGRVVVGLRPPRRDDAGREVEETEDFGVEIDDELVRRYADIIKTGHEEGCLWRDAGCKDDIYRLPIAKVSVWQPQLRDRYHSFNSISSQLPSLEILSTAVNVQETALQLPPHFLHPESSNDTSSTVPVPAPTPSSKAPQRAPPPPPINPSALAFALLGWTGSADPALATCSACFRRIGLWLHARPPDLDAEDSDGIPKLDLLGNHRDYCPWVNAASQRMPGSFGGLAAWQILGRLIANNSVRRGSAASSRPGLVDDEVDGSTAERVGSEELQNASLDTTREEVVNGSTTSTPKKDAKQVEKEDKARFARLKELTKMMGLKRSKTKKT